MDRRPLASCRGSHGGHRTAQVKLSSERLRQELEAAGRRVLEAQQNNAIHVTWRAQDCVAAAKNAGPCRCEHVGLVDGATWIRDQMELHLVELDGLGLDFYHLRESVHRARRKVFGETSPEGSA